MIDAMRIYYNFCIKHSKFKRTLSEQAGIKMDIQNNRIDIVQTKCIKETKDLRI